MLECSLSIKCFTSVEGWRFKSALLALKLIAMKI